jgi:SAM-dependent methyltransferase
MRNRSQIKDNHTKYIAHRFEIIPRFWRRLGGEPDWYGKTVLDVGCGYGEMSLNIAEKGAAKVVAIDIDEKLIEMAKNNMLKHTGDKLDELVEFFCCGCTDIPKDYTFDTIVSRDTIEHMIHLEPAMHSLAKRLKPNGRFYIGAGPLYRSPYGGHGRMHMPVPWGHLLLPEPWLLKWVNRYRSEKKQATSVEELGLNKVTLAECENIFLRLGLNVIHWRVNHGDNVISRLFRLLSRVPFLREYFGHDIYIVLEKPDI